MKLDQNDKTTYCVVDSCTIREERYIFITTFAFCFYNSTMVIDVLKASLKLNIDKQWKLIVLGNVSRIFNLISFCSAGNNSILVLSIYYRS